ncbi:MAG: hypothetical protein WDZ77_02375 [Candidatus Pacearchaeota archaeon]
MSYPEVELFYNLQNKASCFTFVDRNKGASYFGETNCTLNNEIGNSGFKINAQAVHSNSNGGVFSDVGIGLERELPFSDSLPFSGDLTYYPYFSDNSQQLDWFVSYDGKLPFNAELDSFGTFKYENGKLRVDYGEGNLRIPVGGKNSPFFLGYSRAWFSGEGENFLDAVDHENRFQIGFNFDLGKKQ